jgi:23S rRNA (guanosine2251-2'-O)-methyltransferase
MNRKLKNEELDRLSVEEFKTHVKSPIRVILDDVRSLANVGAVFRTSDAFLIEEIFLCGITGCPPHRDIQKTALGATESVKWTYTESVLTAIDSCRKDGFYIAAIEQSENSIRLDKLELSQPVAIIMGNEVHGVSQSAIDLCDGVIEIPQDGTKHSLNVSVATGVVLWELYKKAKGQQI